MLRSGEWIVSLPDIVTNPASAVYVPFFGRLVQAMTGTAFLAVKSGARVLPMYCRRTEGERFLLRFDPEVPIPDTSRFEEDVYEGTARIYRSMEMQFRRFPEHWWQWNRLTQRLARGVEPVTDPTAARRQLRDLIPRVGFDNAALSEVLRDLYARLPAVRDEVRLPDPTGANRDGSPGLAPYA